MSRGREYVQFLAQECETCLSHEAESRERGHLQVAAWYAELAELAASEAEKVCRGLSA